MSKIRSIFTLGFCIVLFATLLFSNIILAQDGGSYDPWIDTNDDGIVDAIDLQALASIYSTSGTPINKTELLLELEARLNSLNATLLADYYNITNCDILFALLGHLHSGDDISGGTLRADQIRLGSSGGNRYIYFYEDGSPIGEYIYWHNAEDGFYVSDDIQIGGDIEAEGTIIGDGSGLTNVPADTDWMESGGDVYRETGNIGIGTPTPETKLDVSGNATIRGTLNATELDVAGDIQGETLRVDEIQLGSTEGNHVIYFYEDGVSTTEYIYWYNVGDRFYVSDDIQISGTITIPTTTRYYSVQASAWQPAYSTYDFYSGVYTSTDTAGSTLWYAPVNLPHDAVVTALRVWVYDNDASNIDVSLYRRTPFAVSTLASIQSSGSSPSYVPYDDSSISYSTIDNINYAYHLYGLLRSGDNNHRLSNVRITYTITEPLP